jgi:predicted sugar kinase
MAFAGMAACRICREDSLCVSWARSEAGHEPPAARLVPLVANGCRGWICRMLHAPGCVTFGSGTQQKVEPSEIAPTVFQKRAPQQLKFALHIPNTDDPDYRKSTEQLVD